MNGDNMNCIFCKIANGEIPSYTLYEDDIVIVFMDINPDSNGHLLIVPKEHTLDMTTIKPEIISHIMSLVTPLYNHLKEKLNLDGLTLIQNNGDVQEVKHFHLHLKPYYNNNEEIKSVEEIYEKIKGFNL